MDFATLLTIAGIGTVVISATSGTEPPRERIHEWAVWRSKNFTGTIVEKTTEHLVFQLEADEYGQPVFVHEKDSECIYNIPNPSIALAQNIALEKIEAEAEMATSGTTSRLRRQIAIDRLWQEIQRLKLANATNNVPTVALDRAKMFPTLMALVNLSGNNLNTVASSMETRLWDRVRKSALWEAKLLMGNDAVRTATTTSGKLDAAANILWNE